MSCGEDIKKIGLFKNLTDEEASRVGDLCKETDYQPGDIIIEEDRPGEALYLLRTGSARVVKVEGDEEHEIAEIEAGEHVGEMSLIDGMTTSARVVTKEACKCIALYKEDLDLLLNSDDKLHINVLRAMIRTLAERLRRTSESLILWKVEFDD